MMNEDLDIHHKEAVTLLKELIAVPSFSREEDQSAGIISRFLARKGIETSRVGNNVFSLNKYFDKGKKTILLNSHHDTVKPNSGYSLDPFDPIEKEGKLWGLGSNDAGGALVALISTFLHFYATNGLKYNLVLAATAEEEISGTGGIEYTLKYLPAIDCAIVGEPTQMELAIAERGLLVLDCLAKGKAGHAARNEGDNAIYKALKDIEWLKSYSFPKSSDLLGPVTMNVTVIETENKAHNVVPAECKFVTDVRVNELYDFDEVIEIIRSNVACELKPRSKRLRSTMIPTDHPLVKAGMATGKKYFGSPTTSDKALMPFPALKMGPGDSARSHMADEYIFINEIKEGIADYIRLLDQILI
jgi:acetylornithine deacetylase